MPRRGSWDDDRVHLPAGFKPAGLRVRAVCHCGWTSTPRVDQRRALAALAEDHGWSEPKCARCGRNWTPSGVTTVDAALLGMHRDVQIVDAGRPGRERLLCASDVGACDEMWSRMRAAINSLDPHAGGSAAAGEQLGTVLPFRRRNGARP